MPRRCCPGSSRCHLVYNNHLNGDWKRQHFYRPSRERVAQQALYEWVHDPDFNSVMGQSKRQISLEGVFDRCPIPTLILEGKWDLTWSEGKQRMLHQNHPGSEMVVFERAGHSIYDEEPERFFAVLERFIRSLPEVPEAEALTWGGGLHEWRRKIDSAPRDELGGYGWGRSSNEKLAQAHDADLLQRLRRSTDLLKLGFALYDCERYEEALAVLHRLEALAADDERTRALAWIWQGHMLDRSNSARDAPGQGTSTTSGKKPSSPTSPPRSRRRGALPAVHQRRWSRSTWGLGAS